MIIVGNIFTSRHALKNEANVILLFGDSVLGQEESIIYQYSFKNITAGHKIEQCKKRLTLN